VGYRIRRMVTGIILAAGASTRMGRPKALLPHPATGEPFLIYLVNVFRRGGTDEVIVVGRPSDPLVRTEAEGAGAHFIHNPAPLRGQLSSLLTGIDLAERLGVQGVLVSPVDLPGITPAVVARLIAAAGSAAIIRPTHAGRSGHPIYFSRDVFAELRDADPALGARAVVRADASRVLDVPWEDAGILMDVDTPEDYERLIGR
jgi:molybdenum cofactor cytidylyltransferase